MFFGDIPIWLINMALWCMVATPFLIVASSVYLAHKLVRPGWALYWLHREESVAESNLLRAVDQIAPRAPAPRATVAGACQEQGAPQGTVNPVRESRVSLSAFGR